MEVMKPDLLESVFRSPDDDAPRRALADSLRRDGDPRGEFIALQLDTQLICWSETKLGALRRVDVAPEVRARMTALFRKHRRAEFDDARAGLNAMGVARGFVEPAQKRHIAEGTSVVPEMVHRHVPRSHAGLKLTVAPQQVTFSSPQIARGRQHTTPTPVHPAPSRGPKDPCTKLQPAMGAHTPPRAPHASPVACGAGGTQHTPSPSEKRQPGAPAVETVPFTAAHDEALDTQMPRDDSQALTLASPPSAASGCVTSVV